MLVLGVDALSTMVDWTDRGTAVLFGDGAGAAVLVHENGTRGILGSMLRSSGGFWDLLYVKNRGVQTTMDAEARRAGEDAINMKGPELFKIAVKSMEDVTRKVAEGVRECSSGNISLIVPHQANLRINQRGRAAARPRTGQGLHQRRSLREHLGGLGADRARRGDRGGTRSRR